jgi:hypothetical protein
MTVVGLLLLLLATPASREASVRLTTAPVQSIPPDKELQLTVHLSLENNGKTTIYVPPVMGQLAGTLSILARPAGSDEAPTPLHSWTAVFSGYFFEDLFALRPRRRLQYTLWVPYRPLIKGEGKIEIWTEYDCTELSKGDSRAFSAKLTSEPAIVEVKKQSVVIVRP